MATETRKPATTMAEIRRRNRDSGGHWFDAGTMRFFRSKVEAGPYVGATASYFVTTELPPHGPRGYAVAVASPDGDVKRVDYDGDLCGMCRFAKKGDAIKSARELAAADRGGA